MKFKLLAFPELHPGKRPTSTPMPLTKIDSKLASQSFINVSYAFDIQLRQAFPWVKPPLYKISHLM
jgi:hypothetical protein